MRLLKDLKPEKKCIKLMPKEKLSFPKSKSEEKIKRKLKLKDKLRVKPNQKTIKNKVKRPLLKESQKEIINKKNKEKEKLNL
jgi:hypothetical protein